MKCRTLICSTLCHILLNIQEVARRQIYLCCRKILSVHHASHRTDTLEVCILSACRPPSYSDHNVRRIRFLGHTAHIRSIMLTGRKCEHYTIGAKQLQAKMWIKFMSPCFNLKCCTLQTYMQLHNCETCPDISTHMQFRSEGQNISNIKWV